jgi:hypothetical protein
MGLFYFIGFTEMACFSGHPAASAADKIHSGQFVLAHMLGFG